MYKIEDTGKEVIVYYRGKEIKRFDNKKKAECFVISKTRYKKTSSDIDKDRFIIR